MAKKRKFNAVDAVILIVIAAVIGVAAFLVLRDKPETVNDNAKIEYVIEFRKVRDEFVGNFTAGEKVVDSVAKYQIGEVTAVSHSAALYEGSNMTAGQASVSRYTGYSDVQVTVVADAAYGTNGRYVIGGGYDISVGSKVSVRLPRFNGTGYCVGINEVEAE